DMREQENRTKRRMSVGIRAIQNCDQPALLRMLRRRKQVQIAVRIAGRAQSGSHLLRGLRTVAGRERGVGLDELAIDLAERGLVRSQSIGMCGGTHRHQSCEECASELRSILHENPPAAKARSLTSSRERMGGVTSPSPLCTILPPRTRTAAW